MGIHPFSDTVPWYHVHMIILAPVGSLKWRSLHLLCLSKETRWAGSYTVCSSTVFVCPCAGDSWAGSCESSWELGVYSVTCELEAASLAGSYELYSVRDRVFLCIQYLVPGTRTHSQHKAVRCDGCMVAHVRRWTNILKTQDKPTQMQYCNSTWTPTASGIRVW